MTRQFHQVLAGVTAGSISAILAALASLPLRSPDDILLNSATVVIGALITGIASGVIWRVLSNRRNRLFIFTVLWAIGFIFAGFVAVAGETQLDHFLTFVLPLAAIVFSVTGLLTVLISWAKVALRWWMTLAAVVIALAVGITLAGQGDQESGRLELPPRTSISAQPAIEGLGQISATTHGLNSEEGVQLILDGRRML